MKIKIILPAIILGLSALLVIPACKKYEEGPALSLRSKKERVANTWKIENYKINGTDFTSLVTDYTETFTKEGAYSYSWGLLSGSTTWAFQNDKMEIKLNGSESHTSRTLFIKKLEEKSFWYTFVEDSDSYEVHLVQK